MVVLVWRRLKKVSRSADHDTGRKTVPLCKEEVRKYLGEVIMGAEVRWAPL
jgi:hypothetical protein